MTKQERIYLEASIKLMEKLEGTFSRGFAPILNSIYRAAAKEVDAGNVRTTDIVVDRYTQRERDYLQKRYAITADAFGKLARQFFSTEKGVSVKAPLSPEYWETMERWGREIAALKVTYMDVTTKKAIAAVVLKGLREGEGVAVIAKNLRKVGLIASRSRANLISRTETHNAANMSAKTMAVDTLGAREKKWLNAGDNRVRTSHQDVSGGEWIPVNESFSVGGEMLEYPGDPFGSAWNVCNCRCAVMYQNRTSTGGLANAN